MSSPYFCLTLLLVLPFLATGVSSLPSGPPARTSPGAQSGLDLFATSTKASDEERPGKNILDLFATSSKASDEENPSTDETPPSDASGTGEYAHSDPAAPAHITSISADQLNFEQNLEDAVQTLKPLKTVPV